MEGGRVTTFTVPYLCLLWFGGSERSSGSKGDFPWASASQTLIFVNNLVSAAVLQETDVHSNWVI